MLTHNRLAKLTFAHQTRILTILLAAALLFAGWFAQPAAASPTALPAGYFYPQTFSTFASPSTGEVCGNAFTVSQSGAFLTSPKVSTYSPGYAPANSGMPGSLHMLEWGSANQSGIVTITFNTPLDPSYHIFLEDLDYYEQVKLEFYDTAGVLIDPSSFTANPISLAGAPLITSTPTDMTFKPPSAGAAQNEPYGEILPGTAGNPIKKIVLTGTGGTSNQTVEAYFSCSRPSLAQAFNPAAILQDSVTTLTFTLSQINGNPLANASFTDTLPGGLQVAASPNLVNNCGNGSVVTAAPGSASIRLSNFSLAYNNAVGPTCTILVDVTSRPSKTNLTCAGFPQEFTNFASNLAAGQFNLSALTPACLVVNYLPPSISSFTPGAAGTGKAVIISGQHLTSASAVSFGGAQAKSFTVDSDTQITAVVAAGASGQVSVTTPGGTAYSANLFNFMKYTFIPMIVR